MAQDAPELAVHKEWLGQIQQIGLVVSPHVLAKHNVGIDRQRSLETQAKLREIASEGEEPRVNTFLELVTGVLDWPEDLLAGAPGGPDIPESLTIALPEYDDRLSPTYAIPGLALISVVGTDATLDKPLADQKSGWRASPHARLERLLRETNIPIGLLFNHTHLRLIYAPRGESSGHLTFRFKHLLETLGRPMAGALYALLGMDRVTDVLPDAQRLPALLHESRKYQNVVSTKLAGQVLEALWQLLRGFQRANDETKGTLLAEALRENPQEVYGGLLSTLMRLVFILYAEDRGLMPASDVYQKHYAVSGLFERLREDAARYPDTMDARFGAWAQLLTLFRLIHDGGRHDQAQHDVFRFPPRHGRLFNPDAYPFLEGRPLGSARVMGAPIDPPRVPDGVVFRVLQNLLILDGERLSYRALDVEQIGSVYEAMMGFALQQATGPSIAVRPKHIVVNLAELLEQKPKERAAWLQNQAELKVTGDALARATTVEEALAALGKKVSREYTPAPLAAAVMYLQPTEERRRSGSHYTPRSLTAPIVQTTFRPIFERLGDQATPEQILDLKVCDPAMGSGAFLVEACRLLAERLVRAWEVHKSSPAVPDDEDVLTYARRLVAERCLYGVDKNVFAVDLAKLSLWLATLAREHPFTFLDHALRHGDSLVGLSREQIACLHWKPGKQLPLIRTFLDARVAEAQRLREQIQSMGSSDDVPEKARLLREAEEAIADVRLAGDVVVSAFFEREKPKDRETLRTAYAGKIEHLLVGAGFSRPDRGRPVVGADFPGRRSAEREGGSRPDVATFLELTAIQESLRDGDRPVPAFHWELEFPEVFTRANPGFDAFVGNPPFFGGTLISGGLGAPYLGYLTAINPESGNRTDLVVYFLRRAFQLVNHEGVLGLIATNTVAQGDSRVAGLRWIARHGGTLLSAERRLRWPGNAAVVVSVIHVIRSEQQSRGILDGRPVPKITAFLLESGTDDDPTELVENRDKCFEGYKIAGQGFLFADDEAEATPLATMRALLERCPAAQARVRPYMGGEELNSSPTLNPHRFAIYFGTLSLEAAEQWPELLDIVRTKVKPQREVSHRDAHRVRWWQYGEVRPGLESATLGLPKVLALSRLGNALAFAFLPAGILCSERLLVFAEDREGFFAALQSRVHDCWARVFGSSMKDDLLYTPSTCFVTFPFPVDWRLNHRLEEAGRTYYDFRAALMVRNNEGLTKTYNRFHDPDEHDADIIKLRDLHAAMDGAVLDAYGWTDIQPTCEFILDYVDDDDDTDGQPSRRKKPWRYRWPDEIRDEVLGRLLELNAQRAKEEALAGAVADAEGRPHAKRQRLKSKAASTPLLDD